MLALVAGTGALPGILADRLIAAGAPPVVCALEGYPPDVPEGLQILSYRLETFGSLLASLREMGVSRVCLAGAIRRPQVDPAVLDAATRPLIPRLMAAIGQGDDGALRVVISLFEEAGMEVMSAGEIAPDLLPAAGVPTRALPTDDARADAAVGAATVAEMGRADLGQACVIRMGAVASREGQEGTDAMLMGLEPGKCGILFKAPKPGQDRRADLPVIGPSTAANVVAAGLAGIVIEAGGVMVIDLARVIETLDRHGMFLWVRPAEAHG